MLKKIFKFILIVIWMGTIFMFSSDNSIESTKKSDSVIVKIGETILNRKLTKSEQEKYIESFVVLVRKGAHFTVYLILGVLLISFIKEFRTINFKTLILTVFLACLYACSDEIHQLFVSGRSGEIRDIFIDTSGAFFGCLLYYGIYKLRRKKYE